MVDCQVTWHAGGTFSLVVNGEKIASQGYHPGKLSTWTEEILGSDDNLMYRFFYTESGSKRYYSIQEYREILMVILREHMRRTHGCS